MPYLGYYQRGTWNGQCDECGRGFKFYELRLRWDQLWVCRDCWEPKHPQLFVRGVKDDPSVPVARPRIISTGLAYFFWTNGSSNFIFDNTTSEIIWTN